MCLVGRMCIWTSIHGLVKICTRKTAFDVDMATLDNTNAMGNHTVRAPDIYLVHTSNTITLQKDIGTKTYLPISLFAPRPLPSSEALNDMVDHIDGDFRSVDMQMISPIRWTAFVYDILCALYRMYQCIDIDMNQ